MGTFVRTSRTSAKPETIMEQFGDWGTGWCRRFPRVSGVEVES